VIHQKGRERYCEAKMEKLSEISSWLDQYKKFWNHRFDAMEKALIHLQSKSKPNERRK